MNITSLERQFARMGAALAVRPLPNGFSVDVLRERGGSRFELAVAPHTQVCVSDLQTRGRHLLLSIREAGDAGKTHKYLCGHDERDWFAAAVPDTGAASVNAAKEALKPSAVRLLVATKRVKRQHRNRRHNAAFVRQGEWFFIPMPRLRLDELRVLHNEPLVRGRGKPHVVEFLHRDGGELVYVSNEHPRGLSEAAYHRLIAAKPSKKSLRWRTLRRNPHVYARGRV